MCWLLYHSNLKRINKLKYNFWQLPAPTSQVEELSLCEDKDLGDLLKQEISRHNSILHTITTALESAVQATTVCNMYVIG